MICKCGGSYGEGGPDNSEPCVCLVPKPPRWQAAEAPIDGGGNLRGVEQFTGMRVTVLEGNGSDTVLREVVHYFDEYGNRVAVVDPFPEGRA